MTEEQKQALIEYCKEEARLKREHIARLEKHMPGQFNLTTYQIELQVAEIALSALTAQPVKLPDRYDIGSMIDVEKDDDGPLYLREDVIGAIRAAGYQVEGE